ncbi:MAG: fluoride efflux transporter FluC [Acidimicrobiales bacterium]
MAPTFDPKEESAPVSPRSSRRSAHPPWRSVALVAAGGVLGTPARYAIAEALPNSGHGFPTATFITNLTGSLILGALLEGLARGGPDEGRRHSARLLVGTGICGAYTTYSTFAVDSDQLLRAHRIGLAIAYALGTVMLGLVATGLGIALAAGYHRGRGFPAILGMDPDLDVSYLPSSPGSPSSPGESPSRGAPSAGLLAGPGASLERPGSSGSSGPGPGGLGGPGSVGSSVSSEGPAAGGPGGLGASPGRADGSAGVAGAPAEPGASGDRDGRGTDEPG